MSLLSSESARFAYRIRLGRFVEFTEFAEVTVSVRFAYHIKFDKFVEFTESNKFGEFTGSKKSA